MKVSMPGVCKVVGTKAVKMSKATSAIHNTRSGTARPGIRGFD
jgi:hypothetical protein